MTLLGFFVAGASLLVAAGLAKAVRPTDTSNALAATFGWWAPRPGRWIVRGAAGLEAGLGMSALWLPLRPVAAAVAASYLAFAVFVVIARQRGGPLATCGCFAGTDTPATRKHAVINSALALACGFVAWRATGTDSSLVSALRQQYAGGLLLVPLGAGLAGCVYLVLVPLARLEALRKPRAGSARVTAQ
jgi:hypothetical protein